MPTPKSPDWDRENVLETAEAWHKAGTKLAIATVIQTWGSSPRQPGSQLVIGSDRQFVGSVSGGCVETTVVTEADAVIATGVAVTLTYGVTNEMAWEVGLACGGKIRVYLERAFETGRGPFARVLVTQRSKRSVVLATNLATGEHQLVYPLQDPLEPLQDPLGSSDAHHDDVSTELLLAAKSALQEDRGQIVDLDSGSTFLTVYNAPLRLVIVGAVHIAQVLAKMASLSGFEVIVVDPRKAFATEQRFPGLTLVPEWPTAALQALKPDHRTAVVTLTHDRKLDDPALFEALMSDAFYIGSLGSRRTHAARLERLSALGCSPDALNLIHGPVGLNIGARSPAEIAISILAQVIETLRTAS